MWNRMRFGHHEKEPRNRNMKTHSKTRLFFLSIKNRKNSQIWFDHPATSSWPARLPSVTWLHLMRVACPVAACLEMIQKWEKAKVETPPNSPDFIVKKVKKPPARHAFVTPTSHPLRLTYFVTPEKNHSGQIESQDVSATVSHTVKISQTQWTFVIKTHCHPMSY